MAPTSSAAARFATLPRRLAKLLPSRREPYDFFEHVRFFLTGPATTVRLTNNEGVRRYLDEPLTAAVVRDCEAMLLRVSDLENAVKEIEGAFKPGQLADILHFAVTYRALAVRHTTHHEKVPHTLFGAYVKNLSELVGFYVEIKKRFMALRIAPTWAIRRTRKEIMVPMDITQFNKRALEIDRRLPTDRQMATIAIKNYQMAIQLFTKLRKPLLQQCDNMIEWLNGPKCLEAFRQQCENSKSELASNVDERQEEYRNEIVTLKNMVARNRWKPSVAHRSLRGVATASDECPSYAVECRRMLYEISVSVYSLALEILEAFHYILEDALPNLQNARMKAECRKVSQICNKWIHILELQNSGPARVGAFQSVLDEVPRLFKYITYFTFKFMSV